ncbi:AbrB/MazE/SpoVT family DNA-binding domain-containing protein [Rhizobium redzepovicii]|uniref:AbrB/MazE/SpoVT family DNA-binding domain-containing protein n=1 Tax=Rhizobium redzepovicii TaxID=2867518 RepID=A0AAW8P2T7_9HYPH|nr:AbrB/MazE/SpoVT family DNA-binding domain-containing protein [Rhizobium redzepovicii]MDR9761348.1 AbrB/MazE/SpoVT family DNA-binding domain-containing protein [Rhizobium redzepovicii]
MRVTSKGQVTIPRDLRELAGIEANSEVIFSIENGKQEIEDRGGLDRFLQTIRRLEGTGDQAIDAEDLMSMTRDR